MRIGSQSAFNRVLCVGEALRDLLDGRARRAALVFVFDVRGKWILLGLEQLQHRLDRRVALAPWIVVDTDVCANRVEIATLLAVLQVQVCDARMVLFNKRDRIESSSRKV